MAGLLINFGANVKTATAGIKEVSLTLKEQQGILQKLRYEYAYLDATQRKSAFGKTMAADIRIASAEISNFKNKASSSFGAVGNAATKGLSSIRSLAYILPGIGIAGIFSLAFEGISKLLSSTKELSAEEKRLQEIRKSSLADLGKERSQVDQLVLLLRNENTTKSQKISILNELKKIAPSYFSDLSIEKGLVNDLNIAYGSYLKSLAQRSEVVVLTKQLDDLSAKIIDLEQKGATVGFFSPELTRTLDGNLRISKALTKEQIEQNRLNIPYNHLLQEREKILAQIAGKSPSLIETLNLKDGKANVTVDKVTMTAGEIEVVSGGEAKGVESAAIAGTRVPGGVQDFTRVNARLDEINKMNMQIAEGFARQRQEAQKLAETISGTLAPAFSSMFTAILEGKDPIKAMFQTLAQSVQQLIAQLIQAAIKTLILRAITSFGTGGASSLISIASGFNFGRATGGPVAANQPYLVGERRAEIFVPSTSGRILPTTGTGMQGSASPIIIFNGRLAVSGNKLQLLLNRTDRYNNSNV